MTNNVAVIVEQLRQSLSKNNELVVVHILEKSKRPGPFGHLEAKLVQQHKPLLEAAIQKLVEPTTIADRWLAERGRHPAAPPEANTTAEAFVRTLQLNTSAFDTVMRRALTDSWEAGIKDANAQIVVKAGSTRAAALVNTSRIKGMTDTVRKDIGKILEQALAGGWSGPETAKALDALLHDPKRAYTIAVTEINRAMSLASLSVYTENGYDWDLLTMPNACKVCLDIAKQNPHPVTDKRIPPEHTLCRCAPAAHIK